MERFKNIVYLIALILVLAVISSFTADPEVDDNTPLQSEVQTIEMSAITLPDDPVEETTEEIAIASDDSEELIEEVAEESEDEEATPEQVKEELSKESDSDIEELAEEIPEENLVKSNTTLEDELILEDLLDEMLYRIGDISYEPANKTYTLTPTQPALILDINTAMEGGLHEEWADLTYGLMDLSFSINDALGAGYTLSMVHPNTGEVLFSAKDGAAVYDIRNE